MQITELRLQDFRSFADATIAFTGGRTLVIGRNGVGKSTVADAIAWCLTGRCRGVDGAGRGTAALIRIGATSATVTVGLADVGRVTRRTDGKNTSLTWTTELGEPRAVGGVQEVQRGLLAALGVRDEVLAAATDATAFLALGHADAKALLLRLLDVRVPVQGKTLTLDEVDQAEAAARQQRLMLKTRLKDLGVSHPPALPFSTPRSALEAQVATLKQRGTDEFAGAQQALGARRTLEGQLARLQQQLQALAASGDEADLGLELAQAEASLAGARAARQAAVPSEDLAALRAEVARIDTLVGRLQQHSPSAGCVLAGDVPCKTPAKAFAGHLTTLAQLREQLTGRARAVTDAEAERTRLQREVATCETRVREIRHQMEQQATREATRVTLQREIAERTGQLAAVPVVDETALQAARQAVQQVEAQIETWRRYERDLAAHDATEQKRASLQTEVAQAEALCEALGPKGLRATALQAALGAFHAAVDATLAAWGFRLAIEVDPWRVRVNGRPAEVLSASERLRLGVALQFAIVRAARCEWAFVDAADLLDRANNAALAQLIMTNAAAPGQVIIAATRDDDYAPPAVPGLQVIRLAVTAHGSGVVDSRQAA